MATFRIYSPTLGKREDFPTILLNKAITPEISNMQTWNGELRKAKLRLAELKRNQYEAQVLLVPDQSDMVAQWRMNDNNVSSTVVDSSGNGHNGTASAATSAMSTTGKIGNALNMNSTSNVVVPDAAALSFGDGASDSAFSISAWVNMSLTADTQVIISKASAEATGEWFLYMDEFGRFKFGIIDTSNKRVARRSDDHIGESGWFHVVGTYDGVGGDGDSDVALAGMNIYVNGVLDNTGSSTNPGYTFMTAGALDVLLGSYSGGNDKFADAIDDTRIYSAELTAAEVTALYNSGTGTEAPDKAISITGRNVLAEFASGDTIMSYDTLTSASFTVASSILSGSDTVVLTTVAPTGSTPEGFASNTVNLTTTDPTSSAFLKVQTPDGFEVINSHRFITSDESERLVAFTKQHIYFWDTTLTKWNLIYTSSSDTTTYWDSDEYGNFLVATNNIDRPIQWDGNTANVFETMDTQLSSLTSDFVSKARFIASYRNYVFLGNVTLSSGTELQDHVYTSNVGEGVAAGGFRQDASKDAAAYFVAGKGEIAGGFGTWNGYLIIFKRLSTRKFWFVGGSIPFEQDNALEDIGCSAPGSVIKDSNENLFFYSSARSIYEISIGRIDKGLNITTRNVNPELNILIRSTFIEEYNEVWWSIPSNADSTANDVVIVFKEPGKWEIRDISVVTFGQFTRQTNYTWDTLPFATWSDWAWDSWTSVEGNAAFPIDLSFDSSGFGYQVHGDYLDDGSAYDSSFVVSTDLADKKALPVKKRINQMFVYVNNESGSGTIAIESKRDTETEWQGEAGVSGGTINLFGPDDEGKTNKTLRQRIPMDLDAFNYQFRATGQSKYSVIGYEFDFEVVGDR